jgi:hypothetical protein
MSVNAKITALIMAPNALLLGGYWLACGLFGYGTLNDAIAITYVTAPVLILGAALFVRQWRLGI